ncbi:MAG: UDP-glucose 4-epimerase GalE [Candidatus Paceibacterota bacterium]
MNKKILITGAGGYIGSVAAYLFLQKGYSVVALDNFSRGFREPLRLLQKKYGERRIAIHKVDIVDGDIDSVFGLEDDIQAVIHYAAFCSVDESVKKPELYHKNNVEGSKRLIASMKRCGVRYIVFSSTCAVYGEAEYVPIDENHPTRPVNPYGESKLQIEEAIQESGLRYVILRYFNVCGATDDGLIGDSKKPSVHLMQNAVRGALNLEKFFLTCPRVNTPDGTPIRDYTNVVDLNQAHVLALEHIMNNGRSEVINLGSGTGNSVLEIVCTVEKITSKTIEKKRTTPREGEYAKMIADISKANKLLGWKPTRSLKDSVRSLVKWYTVHPHGWET